VQLQLYDDINAASANFDLNGLRQCVSQTTPLGLAGQGAFIRGRELLAMMDHRELYVPGSAANANYSAYLDALLAKERDPSHPPAEWDHPRIAVIEKELNRLKRETMKNLTDSKVAASLGSQWQFHPSLRHPMSWAALKKFWVFDKTALAETMLMYNDASIHAALSDAYDPACEAARANIDDIKDTSGLKPELMQPVREVKASGPAAERRDELTVRWNVQMLRYLSTDSYSRDAAIPLVKMGVDYPEIRNEIYFQLLKMLTFCPTAAYVHICSEHACVCACACMSVLV
jgi:hypothetical protein